jgi:hypothetical protein
MNRFFLLLFIFSGLSLTIFGQTQPKLVSGEYGEFIIGVDPDGDLTGYYESSTGAGKFNCIFYLRGKLNGDSARITTWFPDEKETINGTLKPLIKEGQAGFNIKLAAEPGGCWNVNPNLDDDQGYIEFLGQAGTWSAVRVVSAERAYFYINPKARAPQKIYVVKGNAVQVYKQEKGWVEVVYYGKCLNNDCSKRQITRGWLKEKDLFSNEIPLTK